MSLKVLVDMNLSPEWARLLTDSGWPSVHWSNVGDPRASDTSIMAWAKENRHIVFTHDLDFGAALAMTNASGPSVLQVRTRSALPEHLQSVVVAALNQYAATLEFGALIVIEDHRNRVRVLPLTQGEYT